MWVREEGRKGEVGVEGREEGREEGRDKEKIGGVGEVGLE